MTDGVRHTSIRAVTDGEDRLLEADEPLAQLQMRCGGNLPGIVSIPELFDVVRQSRSKGLKLEREFQAFDGDEAVSGFVTVSPQRGEGDKGCELLIEGWRQQSLDEMSDQSLSDRLDIIDRMTAEMTIRLDGEQRVLTADTEAADLLVCSNSIAARPRTAWSEFITLTEAEYEGPLHWRLLDGAKAQVTGSPREWFIRLMPLGGPRENPDGFELLLLSDQPLASRCAQAAPVSNDSISLGSVLSRVLRQPIGRIISNAETIRARLAGPLRTEYTNYAGDIASAGSHLLALLEDLADLEDVESGDFATSDDTVDLSDAVQKAASILSGKSQGKQISIEFEMGSELDAQDLIAKAEFRRVLQILINIVGNAINYSPENSTITIKTSARKSADGQVQISVADEGDGLTAEQQARVFAKYERLGRAGDGGSGLGLYISRRLARAMNGDLTINSEPGEGATFTLTLPKADLT